MATTWFPEGWLLDVPNPGYGELLVTAEARPFIGRPLVDKDWHVELTGADLGAFLAAVTARAAGRPAPEVTRHPEWGAWSVSELPAFVTPKAAQDLLPSLQRAVLLAVAGTDRFERTFYDPDEGPHEPLCVHCDQGTFFTPGALPSEWCDRHGHTAFGMGANRSWESAQEKYTWARERWDRDRPKP